LEISWRVMANATRLDKLRAYAEDKGVPLSPDVGHLGPHGGRGAVPAPKGKINSEQYERILAELQQELVKMQAWVKEKGLAVVIVFEGRDAAGKGGVIKRVTEHLNPRCARIVALAAPTEREKKSWYFQRYVQHLPAKGEIVLFDRSWYNRGGVEKVMGFCTEEEYQLFLEQCPVFENMLIDSGIILIKYWFSVSDEEQEKRFMARLGDVKTQWKLSPMDVQARAHWVDYSKAKDSMFAKTHSQKSPWFVVESDDKKRARLNCISHLLTLIPYGELEPKTVNIPARQEEDGYIRPPKGTHETLVPERY